MATYTTDKIEYGGNIYKLQDSDALPLSGGNVTGPVNFGDSVSMEEASVGDLIITGNASSINNFQANTINGVSVGSDPKFTDTVTTVTTSGSGNAVTAISASNGAITATKGTTFLTSHQDISGKADKSATVSTVAWDATNKKLTKTINGTTTDVVTASTLKTDLGLGNVENKSSATIRGELTSANVLTALGYTPQRYAYDYQVKASKTYTGLIAAGTTAAESNYYAIKVLPTNYSIQWNILYKVTATIAGVSQANGSGKQVSYMYYSGMRNTYAAYAVWNEVTNTSYRPFYYNTVYRAKSAGITNGYGHLCGLSLRGSYNPTTAANTRTVTWEIIDYENCTPTFLDSMVKQSTVPGVGSTNYQGATEFNGTTQGLTRSGSDANTYDRNVTISGFAKAGVAGLTAENIVVSDDGTYFHLKTGNVFDLRYPIVYCSAAVNANTAFAPYNTIPFTITTTQSMTLTPQQPVYIKGILSGTKFTPISTTPLTQEVPIQDDGYQYIYLGIAYSATAVYLTENHPVFQFQNGYFGELMLHTKTVSHVVVSKVEPLNQRAGDLWLVIQ